jgi:superfamily II DNA/RNA helicase
LTSTLLRKKVLKTKKGEIEVYGLDLDSLIWSRNTTSTIYENPIRIKRAKNKSSQHINSYFRQLYSEDAKSGMLDISQDHTGLVSKEDRKKWEQDFIDKKIQSLFCSPTMELGIDIDALSLVMMRNAPPNPANYVQRSGRAGRSGQAALVMTYCSSSSAHDQHYFKNKIDLVAGKVNPPTINLENENLLRTHLHAMYLSFLDIDQFVNEDANGRQGVVNLVDLHTYELIPSVEERLRLSDNQRNALETNFLQIIANFSNDTTLEKLTTKWIKEAPTKFRESLSRWCELHKNTSKRQKQVSDKISRRDTYIDPNKQRELENENRLLLRTLDKLEGIKRHYRDNESEFYIYRYLADEGFTPGYNFPSVPMRANLHQRNGDIKLIQRAKGVAIREFGPGNIIYNGGSKYKVQGIKKDNIVEGFEKAEINEKSGVILLGDKEASRT